MRRVPALLLSLALCLPATAQAKGGHGGTARTLHGHAAQATYAVHATHSRATHVHEAHADLSVRRDSRGRIKRDRVARAAFQHEHPCPSTGRTSGACPGQVVDHVTPLKRGGADRPSNMQWQTKVEAREKDKWE